jgi:hypothetical protein
MLRIAILLAALLIAAAPAAHAQRRPDFSAWQRLLNRYCVPVATNGQPPDWRFDYEQLYVDERIWTLRRSERLEQVRAALLSTPPSQLEPADRLAWVLNTYNFLVVEKTTMNLLVPRRGFLRIRSVDQIAGDGGPFRQQPAIDFEGRSFSLDQFEREVIYGDSLPAYEPRQRAGDPRWMFALYEARAGGVPLLPWAFHGDSLEAQLDRARSIGLALPRIVRADPRALRLELSNLFFDHRMDFGGMDGVVPWLARHGTRETRRTIARLPAGAQPRYVEVDRLLDQFVRPRPTLTDSTHSAS